MPGAALKYLGRFSMKLELTYSFQGPLSLLGGMNRHIWRMAVDTVCLIHARSFPLFPLRLKNALACRTQTVSRQDPALLLPQNPALIPYLVQYWVSVLLAVYGAGLLVGSRKFLFLH